LSVEFEQEGVKTILVVKPAEHSCIVEGLADPGRNAVEIWLPDTWMLAGCEDRFASELAEVWLHEYLHLVLESELGPPSGGMLSGNPGREFWWREHAVRYAVSVARRWVQGRR
jgi:hypothetical protein